MSIAAGMTAIVEAQRKLGPHNGRAAVAWPHACCMHTRSHHGTLTYVPNALDSDGPVLKSPITCIMPDVDTCVPARKRANANNRSGLDNRAIEKPERERPEHESRRLVALSERSALRATHRSAQLDA